MSKKKRYTALGRQMLSGLRAFREALEQGKDIEKLFTVRTVYFDVEVSRTARRRIIAFARC
jgi:hypothetical protein